MLTTLAKPFHPVSMLILSLRKPRPPSNQVALGSDEDDNIQERQVVVSLGKRNQRRLSLSPNQDLLIQAVTSVVRRNIGPLSV